MFGECEYLVLQVTLKVGLYVSHCDNVLLYFSFCKCLSTDHIIVDREICFHELVLGNGQCDDFANRKECAFDKGMLEGITHSDSEIEKYKTNKSQSGSKFKFH